MHNIAYDALKEATYKAFLCIPFSCMYFIVNSWVDS